MPIFGIPWWNKKPPARPSTWATNRNALTELEAILQGEQKKMPLLHGFPPSSSTSTGYSGYTSASTMSSSSSAMNWGSLADDDDSSWGAVPKPIMNPCGEIGMELEDITWGTRVIKRKPTKEIIEDVRVRKPPVVPMPPLAMKSLPFNEVVRKSLVKAFDEGVESPYDFRDAAIAEIMREVEQAAEKLAWPAEPKLAKDVKFPSLEELIKTFEMHMPKVIAECLQSSKRAFLSGGSIIKILTSPRSYSDNWKDCDWDIFVHKDDLDKLPLMRDPLKDKMKPCDKVERDEYGRIIGGGTIYQTYKGSFLNVGKVNVIVGDYEKIEDVLNSFDFRFLQTGCLYADGVLEYVVLDHQAWSDLIHNIIRLNPAFESRDMTGQQIEDTMKRIQKYTTRGFRDCTGFTETGLLRQFCEPISNLEKEIPQIPHASEVLKRPKARPRRTR
jgi:hypothetical protein